MTENYTHDTDIDWLTIYCIITNIANNYNNNKQLIDKNEYVKLPFMVEFQNHKLLYNLRSK